MYVDAFTQVAVKLKDHGVHVVLLVPGWARTRMGGPDGRLTPEESVKGMMMNVCET